MKKNSVICDRCKAEMKDGIGWWEIHCTSRIGGSVILIDLCKKCVELTIEFARPTVQVPKEESE